MSSSQPPLDSFNDRLNHSQAPHASPQVGGILTVANVPLSDLQRALDMIVRVSKAFKGISSVKLDLHLRLPTQDREACTAEKLKPPFTISDKEVSEKLMDIYDGLSQWVNDFPRFRCLAQNWQAIGEFMQEGGYSDDTYPRTGLNEVQLRRSQGILLSYSVFLILYKWVFQPVLVGADTEMQALVTQLLEVLTALEHDKETVRSWRSKIFRAYAQSARYTGHCDVVYTNLASAVKRLLSIAGASEGDCSGLLFSAFYQKVASPAILLATRMLSSSEDYEWTPGQYQARKNRLDYWAGHVYDCNTGREVAVEKRPGINSGRIVCDQILSIFPSLWCASLNGDEARRIVKSWTCMRLQEPDTPLPQKRKLLATVEPGPCKEDTK